MPRQSKKTTTKKTTKKTKEPVIKTGADAYVESVNEKFGGGIIRTLGSITPVRGISCGITSLNYAMTGNPLIGLVPGKMYELLGWEASGKTTTALLWIIQMQLAGKQCAFIDMEHALNPAYAKSLGVNLDDLLFAQPEYGEEALDLAKDLSGAGVDFIVIDSVAALVPKAVLQGEAEDQFMGIQARMMSRNISKINVANEQVGGIIVWINQYRKTMDQFNPQVGTGGNALKFYCSVRLDIFMRSGKTTSIDGATDVLGSSDSAGQIQKIKVLKTKLGMPHRFTELNFMFGAGPDAVEDLYQFALKAGLISQGFMTLDGTDADIDAEPDDVETISALEAKRKKSKKSTKKTVKKATTKNKNKIRCYKVMVKDEEMKFGGATLEDGIPYVTKLLEAKYKNS